jgi:GntR family transcriptional regulator / MocR family aminotransferase
MLDDSKSRVITICRNALSEKSSDQVVYDLLFQSIRRAIEEGNLPVKSVLPSTRELATAINISRSTIVTVYDLLKIGKLIRSKQGSGYRVSEISHIKAADNSIKINKSNISQPILSDAGNSFLKSINYLEKVKDEETAFRPGLPPLDIFAVNEWKKLNNLYWRHVKDSDLSYMSLSGTVRLKESLAMYLNYTRKIKCDPKQIIIVSGSLQSIYAIGTTLVNPGDCVVHENPTFPNVISIFQAMRAKVIGLPIDDQGLNIKTLIEQKEIVPRVIHTAPSCHYPFGVKMSLARKIELINYASSVNSVIIENDYEHEVNNYSEHYPSIYSLDHTESTFFLGTFNRLLHPSIRIGYMVVPPAYLDVIEALLRHLHRFVPNSKQHVLSQYIDNNHLYQHIKMLNEVADERKHFFTATFNDYFEGKLNLSEFATRSLHIYAHLPKGYIDHVVAEKFRTNNIATHTLSKTFLNNTDQQGLIFGFAPVNKKEMKEKIIKMNKIFRSLK